MAALAVVKGLKEKRTGAKSDQATLIFIVHISSYCQNLIFSAPYLTPPRIWVPDTLHPIQSNHLDYSATSKMYFEILMSSYIKAGAPPNPELS